VIRLPIALSAALVLLVPGASAADYDYLRDDGTIRYRFYTDWELLYVERDRSPDVEVGFLNPGDPAESSTIGMPNPGFREILGTDDVVDDDEHFGGRALLGMRLTENSAVEVVFMGWGHDRSATVRDAGPVATGQDLFAFEFPDASGPLTDDSFDSAAVFDLDYDSDFYNGELNYRHRVNVEGADYHFNLLAGLRALRLEEDLDFTSLDELPLGPNGLGTYNISTRNTMIGAQVGVETFVPLWEDRLDFDLYAVAGGYANQANSYINFFDSGSGTTSRQSRIEWDSAGVFEAAAHFTLRVWRGVRVRGGYRAVYLVNIAAAPDQFARTGGPGDFFGNSFDNDATTVFHGPSLGVSVDF